MKNYKFRGRMHNPGTSSHHMWFYGYYTLVWKEARIMYDWWHWIQYNAIVERCTVWQYTWVNDLDWNEIYEWDILEKWKKPCKEKECTAEHKEVKRIMNDDSNWYNICGTKNVYVIWNIHDIK